MANVRLIDANALCQSLVFAKFDTVIDSIFISEAIKNAPTVDAVEVVRCKDCWHSYEGVGERLMCGRCGQNGNGIRLGGVAVKADHFCSYGERRTDNG